MGTVNFKELEQLAGNGDVGAMYELGKAYFSGSGEVGQNYEKARGLFEAASEKGNKGSNYYLGKIYYNGMGVQTNHLKAKEYFEKSANDKNVFSEFYLGKIYFWGDGGVGKDVNKANEYKLAISNNPLYKGLNEGLQDFYSEVDFEGKTEKCVGALKNKIDNEYRRMFGNEEV